jgi:hypothetical protein
MQSDANLFTSLPTSMSPRKEVQIGKGEKLPGTRPGSPRALSRTTITQGEHLRTRVGRRTGDVLRAYTPQNLGNEP